MLSSEKRFPEYLPIVLLLALTAVLVYLFFGPVIHHPNNYLFAAGGDGLKTYYSSSWFVQHNPDGFTHTGLAYPHGNHVVYADLNPLLSIIMRFVDHHLFSISKYVVGITNLSIILSFFPCAFFVYLILRKNDINQLFSLVFALSITWLSPQIDRFTGHYALSYLFFVPMLWYFLIRMFEGNQAYLWLGLYVLALLVFEFAHPYHFLIGAVFLYAYLFVHALQHLNLFRENWRLYLSAAIAVVLPVVILKAWEIMSTDTATDFVKYPYGFLYYTTGFETLFLPWKPTTYGPSPFWEAWNYMGVWERITDKNAPRSPMEGAAYVGLPGLLMLGFVILRMLHLLWKGGFASLQVYKMKSAGRLSAAWKTFWARGPKRILKPTLPTPLMTAIWAAALMLILASAWPFRKFPDLLELFDFVRQFRSLGRLSWPFYYTFMALSAWYLYAFFRFLRQRSGPSRLWIAGLALIGLCVFSWALDARVLTKNKRDYFLKNTINPVFANWKVDYKGMLAEKGFQPDDFQAIIAFPFYHIGSEKIALEGKSRHWNASFFSKASSLSCGLPIVNNYTARAPLTPSLETIQLVSHPNIRKRLAQKFPSEKPFLLLYPASKEDISANEQAIIDQSQLVFQHANMNFASLPLSAFSDQQDSVRARFLSEKDSMFHQNSLYFSDSTSTIAVEGFGDAFFAGDSLGAQAQSFPNKGRMMIYETSLTSDKPDLSMEVSVWVRLDGASNYLPQLICQQFEGEKAVGWDWIAMKGCTDIYGNWARASIDFSLLKSGNTVKIFTDGDHLVFDNLLIRPRDVDVYSEPGASGSFMLNNYLIEGK